MPRRHSISDARSRPRGASGKRPLRAGGPLSADGVTESAWIEVIRKMDEVYADLVRYQVELESKNAELEEAQQFISSVLASMQDVLIVCDADGRIQQTNQALETLTGLSGKELAGRSVQELFSADSRALAMEFADKLRGDAIHDCEVTLVGREGDVPLAMNCTPRHDYRGRVAGKVLIGRPVGELRRAYEALNRTHAELKQAQQQLIQSEKMASLGRLVAGVAHELNNPISFVYGNVHALRRYAERLHRYLDAVNAGTDADELKRLRAELRIDRVLDDLDSLMEGTLEGADRVREIVQNLRQFSSDQRGVRAEFDLVKCVRTAVEWVTKGARTKPRIHDRLPDALLVTGHPGRMQQVFMNLAQNALDAMAEQEQPLIELDAATAGDSVRIMVRDTGPGIEEQDQAQVFDPFFTTKPVGEGTGLGLAISYGIVAEHGGHLSAANHADGGAVFTVELPVSGTAAKADRVDD
jgi:two-component system sensor histidine kinase HupT/HoxJ